MDFSNGFKHWEKIKCFLIWTEHRVLGLSICYLYTNEMNYESLSLVNHDLSSVRDYCLLRFSEDRRTNLLTYI